MLRKLFQISAMRPALRFATASASMLLLVFVVGCNNRSSSNTHTDGNQGASIGVDQGQYSSENAFSNSNSPKAGNNPEQDWVLVEGKALYEDVDKDTMHQLDYANSQWRPIRQAVVQALDPQNQTSLYSTLTDDKGKFSLTLPRGAEFSVKVLAQAESLEQASWSVSVEDNTQGNATYFIESETLSTISFGNGKAETLEILAASGWSRGELNATRASAPFAILDTMLDGFLFLEAQDLSKQLRPLVVAWSENNIGIKGSIEDGDIESTHYSNAGLLPQIFITGLLDYDADEFDSTTLLHEFAHYAIDSFSRADTVGGPHGDQSKLDSRVAFNEALANLLAAIINRSPVFTDNYGANQALVYRFNLEMNSGSYRGWYSVRALSTLLWDLYDELNEGPDSVTLGWPGIKSIITHPDYLQFEGATNIYAFLSLAKSLYPQYGKAIQELAAEHGIESSSAYAENEVNDANSRHTLPLYKDLALYSSTLVCSDSDFSDFNGADVHQLVMVKIPDDGYYKIKASAQKLGLAETNPEFKLYQRGQLRLSGLSNRRDYESVSYYLEAGNYLLDVFERSNADYDELTGGLACFDLSLNYDEQAQYSQLASDSGHCQNLAAVAGSAECAEVSTRPNSSATEGLNFKSAPNHRN